MPLPGTSTASAGIDGKFYVAGGCCSPNPYLQIYDLQSGAWKIGPSMSIERSDAGAAALNGLLFVMGGSRGQGNPPPGYPAFEILGSVDVYDPYSGKWAPAGTYPPMPTPRFRFAVAELGGKLYAVGGIATVDSAGNFGPPVATLEVYDPATNMWSRKADMLTPHFYLGAAVLNGRLYVMSGQAGSDLEIYDPTRDVWTRGDPVPGANTENYAVTGTRDAIYALGGDVGGQPPVATAAVQKLTAALQLVDPIPDLIDPNSNDASNPITTDLTTLALNGKSVVGVSTDGTAEVIVRIPMGQGPASETLTLTGGTGSSDQDGYLEALFNPPGKGNSITVASQNTPVGPMAFAIYHAPKDYTWNVSDATTQRSITLQRSDGGSMSVVLSRPPALLIHGLWSGASIWKDFSQDLRGRFDHPFYIDLFVNAADYSDTNYRGIRINTALVMPQLITLREWYRKELEVAAVQVDLVGHSMGGLISRYLAKDSRSSKANPQTYGKGFVHKIITIDTPHAGSKLAVQVNASDAACRQIFSLAGMIVAPDGATGDLAPSSGVLSEIQGMHASVFNVAPVHAIVNYETAGQDSVASALVQAGKGVLISAVPSPICPTILPQASFHDAFGEDNDLLVGVSSQRSMFPDSAVSTALPGTIHIHFPLPWLFFWVGAPPGALDAQSEDPAFVFHMLNTPVTDPAYWVNP